MTPEQLKALVLARFHAVGLLDVIDLQDSTFGELPRFFEVSHLSMDLTVTDPCFAPAVRSLVDQIKSDLFVSRGVELDAGTRCTALVGR